MLMRENCDFAGKSRATENHWWLLHSTFSSELASELVSQILSVKERPEGNGDDYE